jgi:hypothetical protein
MTENLMKKNKKGRPPIKPSIECLIYEKATTYRNRPRKALAIELYKFIKEEMGEVPPTEETIIKMVSEARHIDHFPEDELWSLATLERYPIEPEALPAVLKVWVYHEEHYWEEVSEEKEPGMQFSIRDAKWAARLYSVTNDIETLTVLAKNYSFLEKVAKALGFVFDSTELDLTVYSHMTGDKIIDKRRESFLLNSSSRIGCESLEDFTHELEEYSPYEKSMLFGNAIKPKIKEGTNKRGGTT